MKKLQKGFTLIELMIVVAIIAILAAVAAPKFGNQLKKSKDAKGLAVVGNWRSALSLEYADSETYETAFSTELQAQVDKGTLGATVIASTAATTAGIEVGTGSVTVNTKPGITIGITGTQASGTSIEITAGGTDTKSNDWTKY